MNFIKKWILAWRLAGLIIKIRKLKIKSQHLHIERQELLHRVDKLEEEVQKNTPGGGSVGIFQTEAGVSKVMQG